MQESGGNRYIKAVLNLLTALAAVLLTVLLLPRVLGFFMPFVIAWIVAMIANPLVRFFDRRLRIRRKAGSAIVIILVIGAIIGLGYMVISRLITEGAGFLRDLPAIWQGVEQDLNRIGENLTEFYARFPLGIQESLTSLTENLGAYVGNLINSLSVPTVAAVGNFAKNIPSILVGMIMCLLSCYFFVAEKEVIGRFISRYANRDLRRRWKIMTDSLKGAVGGYFKAQMIIEFWIYLILMIGLYILEVKYAFIIALLIAVLDFLPIFGTGTVIWPWAVIELLSGDYKMTIGLMIIYGISQLIRQLIQPKIVGDSIGMPAIPTLFLLFIGYKIGSVVGLILAVPVGIVLVNMDRSGMFDTTKYSIRILWGGFNRFRRLNKNDLKDLEVRDSNGENKEQDSV